MPVDNVHIVSSLDEFNDQCCKSEAKLKKQTEEKLKVYSLSGEPEIWYRGQANEECKLLPSLFRFPKVLVNKELKIFHEFSRLCRSEPPRENTEEWNQLFRMQHLFIPTRLLDWSESQEVALYFALKEDTFNRPCLFLFSPILLHILAEHDNPFPKNIRELNFSYISFLEGKCCNNNPIAIKPPYNTADRISAQRGCFTLHGNTNDSLDVKYPDCFEKIVIKSKVARQLWAAISRSRTEYDIFPDDFGLRQHLCQYFYLDGRYDKMIADELCEKWPEDLKIITEGRAPDTLFAGVKGAVLSDKEYCKQEPDLSKELFKWNEFDLDNPKRTCFITAPAGAGKTNYILNYINQIYKPSDGNMGNSFLQKPIVLWCALGQLRPDGTLIEAVVGSLEKLEEKLKFNITVDRVRDLFRKQVCILVIDGLDELARTRSISAARKIVKYAIMELNQSRRLHIIFGCRDHIYDNYIKNWHKDDIDYQEIKEWLEKNTHNVTVRPLEMSAVHERYPDIQLYSTACKIAAEVPLFLSGVRNLKINNKDLSKVETESDFREVLLDAAFNCNGEDNQEQYQQLGTVAAFMLKKRQDYLKELSTEEKEAALMRQGNSTEEDLVWQIIEDFKKRSSGWPIFIEEAGQWRFVHQSIREYILARNLSYGFLSLPSQNSIVATTSSFDYESAEVYCFLKEILSEGKYISAFKGVLDSCVKSQEYWNNIMRNYFEALGMIGTGESYESVLNEAVDFAIQLLRNPAKTANHPYCTYLTRYNAARFLERIHPSGPSSYCRFRMGKKDSYDNVPDGGYSYISAYAVRGFQKIRRVIAYSNHEIIKNYNQYSHVPIYKMEEVCLVLKEVFGRLGENGELDGGANELATNISQALIRWLPHSQDSVTWLKEQMGNTVFQKAIHSNLYLALWHRGENDCAEKRDGIYYAKYT